MRTPICDFVEKYANDGILRLHMPGHKGSPFLGIEERDITEVEGADVLYSSCGIIEESQKNASLLFGSGKTVYSAEGSSLCIRAMVYSICVYAKLRGKEARILAARNAHKTFLSACALCDASVEWIYPEEGGSLLSCAVSAESLEKKLSEMTDLPVALYITSPDYLGNVSDIAALSAVCKKYGVLLAVDNAHGAYLRFLPVSRHPIDLGADICCDSAHKTLPVLTGGGYLHVSKNAPAELSENIENSMALFASTSPSYLVLQSLDRANRYLSDGYRESLARLAARVEKIKKSLLEKGFSLAGNEEIKLTVLPKNFGYTGIEIAENLREKGIECEFADGDHTVMMFTPEIGDCEIDRLETALLSLPRKQKIDICPPSVGRPEVAISIREAMMSPSELIPAEQAVGRILASPSVSCPPAVPIIACGEVIDESAAECFKYYGIEKIRVVK